MRNDGWGPDAAPPWNTRPTFAQDADLTVYWPDVRPCWEDVASTDPQPILPEPRWYYECGCRGNSTKLDHTCRWHRILRWFRRQP